jgi:protein-tyrosine phosphatase
LYFLSSCVKIKQEVKELNVLFVCTGNTCRSPMAEALARKMGEEQGIKLITDSAGIYADSGDAASREAVEVLKDRYGIDLSAHRSKPLTRERIGWADLVVGITENHARLICQAFGGEGKTVSMPQDVGDPFGGSLATYEACARRIRQGLLTLAERGMLHD